MREWVVKVCATVSLGMVLHLDAAEGGAALLDCSQTEEILYVRGDFWRVQSGGESNRVLVELWLTGEVWKMRLQDPGAESHSKHLFRELGTDGDSTYSVRVMNTNYAGEQIHATPLPDGRVFFRTNQGRFQSSSHGSGSVIEGVVPEHFGEWGDTIVWMAYCSGCYLREVVRSNLPPWYDGIVAISRQGLTLPAAWELEETFPHLPRRLEYHNPGVEFTSRRGPGGSTIMHPVKTRFAYTNFSLSVQAFTNAGRWRVPGAYEARSYRAMWTTGGVFVARPAVAFFGRTIEARVMAPLPDYLPCVPQDTIVGDMRGLPRNYLKSRRPYAISNRWPEPDEAQLLRDRFPEAGQEAGPPTPHRHIHGGRWLVLVGFLFLAAAITPWGRHCLRLVTKQ